MENKCLLAVYAHPDDESFSVAGTFRRYHDEGVKTALICATAGEQGQISNPLLATHESLGQVREQELREACRIIGVQDLTLLGYHDGMLSSVDKTEAVGRIVYHIRRLRPQVVITFDANGDYGHPDHMVVHQLALAAFHKAGDPNAYPDQLRQGLQTFAPSKRYAHSMPWSIMRKVYRMVKDGRPSSAPGGSTSTIPINQMGTPDTEITTWMPLEGWQLAAKMMAIHTHRTQIDPAGPFYPFPSPAVREWLETERFRLIYPHNTCTGERDLFAGIM
jgi:LmbE family N-acetylglucosaminyl deacetylase